MKFVERIIEALNDCDTPEEGKVNAANIKAEGIRFYTEKIVSMAHDADVDMPVFLAAAQLIVQSIRKNDPELANAVAYMSAGICADVKLTKRLDNRP